MKISFVIPCYRSEHTIEGVVSEIKSVVSQRPEVDYEIIMVSDHSPDNVYSVIERMCKADPRHLKGLEFSKNFGQHAALMAGYARTDGDLVFSLDDDGQAPVESVWKMVDKLLADGLDAVYGAYAVKQHGAFRNFGSRINDLMTEWLLGKPADLKISSFYVTRRFVIDSVAAYKGPYPYLYGLLFRVTKKLGNVDVAHRARAEGASGYTFAKLLGLWINGFTAFSVKPLRLASFIGAGCSLCGFVYGIVTVVHKLLHPDTPMGYSSLMSVMLFMGGIIMLILGLIGEYLGRIYICINQSPQYVITRETAHV